MGKDFTELVFILDRSGSMSGLEEDTIGEFNSFIQRQKKEEGQACVSTILFDDKVEVLYDRVPLTKIEPMNENQYYVRGCTALLDAIGDAIHHTKHIHRYARQEDRPEKTMFIIITDGMENASRKYTYKKIKKMIEHEREKYGWEFLFLGANIDAIAEAKRFGVDESRAVNFENDSAGTRLNYQVLSDTVSKVRKSKKASAVEVFDACFDWASPIKKDYKARHKR